MFFVVRKNDRLRLICDTPVANLHFEEPLHTELASGAALVVLEAQRGCQIFVRSGDVERCFYQHLLALHLRPFFCDPSIRADFVPRSFRRRVGITDTLASVGFRLRVGPMGWSWAVHLVQHAHLHLLRDVLPFSP